MLLGLVLLLGTAGAGEAPRNAPLPAVTSSSSVGEASLQAGDRAWWTGDRPVARRAFTAGLREVRAEERRLRRSDEAVPPELLAREARLRLRRIRLGSNWTPTLQAGPMFRALDACPLENDACAVAEAELALLLPPWAGGDVSLVEGLLAGREDAPALARRAAATGDAALVDALRALPADVRDGAGAAIVEGGARLPEDPGTRTFAFGVGGAPGAGLGVSLAWVDPDLGGRRRRLDTQLMLDSRGGAVVGAGLTGDQARARVSASRTVLDDWRSGARVLVPLDSLRGEAAWFATQVGSWRGGPWRVELGLDVRAEAVGAWGAGWGAATGEGEATWARAVGPLLRASRALGTDASVSAWADAALGDYAHLGLGSDARARTRLPAMFDLAGRLGVAAAPLTSTPWWRLPSAGGSQLLRGAPLGRWRAPSLVSAQLEVRRTLWGPLRGAGFLDAVVAGPSAAPFAGVSSRDLHATTGVGLRVAVPGAEAATTRLDAGWSLDAANRGEWGLVVGVGEAF